MNRYLYLLTFATMVILLLSSCKGESASDANRSFYEAIIDKDYRKAIDYIKSYDSVPREEMISALEEGCSNSNNDVISIKNLYEKVSKSGKKAEVVCEIVVKNRDSGKEIKSRVINNFIKIDGRWCKETL